MALLQLVVGTFKVIEAIHKLCRLAHRQIYLLLSRLFLVDVSLRAAAPTFVPFAKLTISEVSGLLRWLEFHLRVTESRKPNL